MFFKGFTVDLKRVKNLPGYESHTFKVTCDPQGANLKMGETSVVLPIEVPTNIQMPIHSEKTIPYMSITGVCLVLQVTSGPLVQVRLCAVVTRPAITVSTDMLQFDTVQCSMCQVIHINYLRFSRLVLQVKRYNIIVCDLKVRGLTPGFTAHISKSSSAGHSILKLFHFWILILSILPILFAVGYQIILIPNGNIKEVLSKRKKRQFWNMMCKCVYNPNSKKVVMQCKT